MTPTTDSDCYVQQLPDLALEPLFEFMAPHDLLHLSMISTNMFHLIEYMRTKATISFTIAPKKTTIHVKTYRNVQSEIIIGEVEEIGENFDCCFDEDFYYQCQKMQNGVVYRYGLEALFPRLLRLYPRAVIGNIKVALSGTPNDEDYEPLFQVLQMLQSKNLNAENVQFEMENGQYSVRTFHPVLKMFNMFGSNFKLPDVLTIEDGKNFPYFEFLNMELRLLRVKNSRMNDLHFNRIVRAWNSSNNTQLRAIIIGTCYPPIDINGHCLLVGLPHARLFINAPEDNIDEASHIINTIQRRSDQEAALVVRKQDEFSIFI